MTMAPSGLKAGDTFVEAGKVYKVDGVHPDGNYRSHYVRPVQNTRRKTAAK